MWCVCESRETTAGFGAGCRTVSPSVVTSAEPIVASLEEPTEGGAAVESTCQRGAVPSQNMDGARGVRRATENRHGRGRWRTVVVSAVASTRPETASWVAGVEPGATGDGAGAVAVEPGAAVALASTGTSSHSSPSPSVAVSSIAAVGVPSPASWRGCNCHVSDASRRHVSGVSSQCIEMTEECACGQPIPPSICRCG